MPTNIGILLFAWAIISKTNKTERRLPLRFIRLFVFSCTVCVRFRSLFSLLFWKKQKNNHDGTDQHHPAENVRCRRRLFAGARYLYPCGTFSEHGHHHSTEHAGNQQSRYRYPRCNRYVFSHLPSSLSFQSAQTASRLACCLPCVHITPSWIFSR